MKLKNIAAAGLGAVVLAVSLAGCSLLPQPPAAPVDKPTTSDTDKPATTETDEPTTEPAPGGAADGAVLNPGDRTSGTGIVPFVNYDDQTANFAHRVTSIEKAPTADVDAIVAEVPQVKGMDVYYVTVTSHYVDGANLEFSAFYTEFSPIDADGNETQEVSLIGWDNCESNSIPKPGNDPATAISNCYAAVVPAGQPAPAGLAWASYDTPFDKYDGKPALFFLG